MTMHLFAAGELIRDPERKTATNGNAYTLALVRAGDEIVSVTAFDAELAERLACLKKGDPVAASGRLQARPYADKEGNPRPGYP